MEKLTLIFLIILCGCSHSQCNNLPQRDKANNEPSAFSESAAKSPRIWVFKETGEKQCTANTGSPIEKMKEQLTKNKIEVFDSKTQDDGMMRIQVCGAPSGQIHVFEINREHAKRALALGFKPLKQE